MEAEGLKRSTIDMVKKIMNPVMEYALELGLIQKNPFQAKKLLAVGGQKGNSHKPITPEDMQKIRKSLPSLPEQERLLLALLAYTGERSGEVCGFKWEDIDYENRQLRIQRGVSWVTRNQPTVEPPKTENSLRSIPLTRTFLDALQPDGQSSFILHKPDGSPLSYTMFAKMLKRTMKRIGFDENQYTAHDFRTTCATEWLEAGIPLKTISAMLGTATHEPPNGTMPASGLKSPMTVWRSRSTLTCRKSIWKLTRCLHELKRMKSPSCKHLIIQLHAPN